MNRTPKTIVLVLAVFVAALAPAASAEAAQKRSATGVVAGKLTGLPKAKGRSISVRVVDLQTRRVVAAAKPKGARYSLRVTPGIYLVSTQAFRKGSKPVSGSSRLIRVRKGKKAKSNVKLRVVKKKRAKRSVAAGPSKHTGKWGRYIIGVEPGIVVRGLDGYPNGVHIDEMMISSLFLAKGCTEGKDFTAVEIRRRAEIIEEIERSHSKYFDKRYAIPRGHLLNATQMIEGSGTVAGGRMTINLRVRDVKTGATRVSVSTEGPVTDFFDLIDKATQDLMNDLCAGSVDVTFTGSGTYSRDEGPSEHSEHHVRASFNWNTTYRGVKLGAAPGAITFAASSTAGGTWSDDGRFGAPGPGNFFCSGPATSYNGNFAMATVARNADGYRITVAPFVQLQSDATTKTCTGLPGPPFETFYLSGAEPFTKATVDADPAGLGAGPIGQTVNSTVPLPAGCARLASDYEKPCQETLAWTGKVTVTKAGE